MSNSSSPAIRCPLPFAHDRGSSGALGSPRTLPIAPAGMVLRGPARPESAYRSPSPFTAGDSAAGAARAGADVGRQRCELVDSIVPAIARMALDPAEGDRHVRPEREGDEGLPEVAVGHRLALRVLPPATLPALPPTVGKTLDDVGGVAHDVDARGPVGQQGTQGLEHRGDLHALVGGVSLGAAGVAPPRDRPRPAAGARVPP